MQGNLEIWHVLTICQTQWRAAFGGVYGLDYNAVIRTANQLGISTGWQFFEKIRVYEAEALNVIRRGADAQNHCDEKQKERCRIEFGEFIEWACRECGLNSE